MVSASSKRAGSHWRIEGRYYNGLKLGQSPNKKRYPLPEAVHRLVGELETVEPKNFATAALCILGFDTASLEKLKDGMARCELSFSKRKGALAVMTNTTDGGGCALIVGCVPLGTPLEEQMVERAKLHKHEHGVDVAVLIMWHPPLGGGKLAVHLL